MTKLTEKEAKDILLVDYPDLKKIIFLKEFGLYIFKANLAIDNKGAFTHHSGRSFQLAHPVINKREIQYVHGICIDCHVPKKDVLPLMIHELFHYVCSSLGGKLVKDEAREEALAYHLQNVSRAVFSDPKVKKEVR